MNMPILVIHGGAGTVDPTSLPPGYIDDRRTALRSITDDAWTILAGGGTALDAVTHAVRLLENCPLFNAGHGAVLNREGAAELDASIMDGSTGRYGGISAVRTVKNPVLGARAVMEKSPHSLLCGPGAEAFARDYGLTMVDNGYFITDERRQALADFLKEENMTCTGYQAQKALSTVGAVARDRTGHLAAATSTGGLTGKLPGRVSDSSVAGAGTWADDKTCALSCTGTGDVFIRNATSRDIACLMAYRNIPLSDAVAEGLRKVTFAGGMGGIIGISADGDIVMDCTARTMSRAWRTEKQPTIAAVVWP